MRSRHLGRVEWERDRFEGELELFGEEREGLGEVVGAGGGGAGAGAREARDAWCGGEGCEDALLEKGDAVQVLGEVCVVLGVVFFDLVGDDEHGGVVVVGLQ